MISIQVEIVVFMVVWHGGISTMVTFPLIQLMLPTIRQGIKLLGDTNFVRGDGVGKTKEGSRKRSGGTLNKYKSNY